MAARLNKRQADSVRTHIKTTKIIQELQKVFDGERDMTAMQFNIAKLLLDKTIPNLKSIEQNIEHDVTVQLVQFSTGEVIEHGQNTHTQPALLSGASVPSNGTGH